MDWLVAIGISNAVVAAVLALVFLPVARLVRRPALVHAVCLVILLKLVTPPLFRVEVWAPERPTADAHPATVATVDDTRVAAPRGLSQPRPAGEHPVKLDEGTHRDAVGSSEGRAGPRFIDWWKAGAWAWLTGSSLSFALATLRLRRLHLLLRFAVIAPADVQDRVRGLAGRLGLSTHPTVWFVPGNVCPMLFGLLTRPRLFVPERLWAHLDHGQQDGILMHELAHYRRGDHHVRLLELVVTVLYWWHPVVWWARGELREAEEQCCDGWVLSVAPNGGRAYATALLEVAEFVSESRARLPSLAAGMGEFGHLQRRLAMMDSGSALPGLSKGSVVAVCCAAAVVLCLGPAWGERHVPTLKGEPGGRLVSFEGGTMVPGGVPGSVHARPANGSDLPTGGDSKSGPPGGAIGTQPASDPSLTQSAPDPSFFNPRAPMGGFDGSPEGTAGEGDRVKAQRDPLRIAVIDLRHVAADEAMPCIEPLLSPRGRVRAVKGLNDGIDSPLRLVVVDYSDNVQLVLSALDHVDRPTRPAQVERSPGLLVGETRKALGGNDLVRFTVDGRLVTVASGENVLIRLSKPLGLLNWSAGDKQFLTAAQGRGFDYVYCARPAGYGDAVIRLFRSTSFPAADGGHEVDAFRGATPPAGAPRPTTAPASEPRPTAAPSQRGTPSRQADPDPLGSPYGLGEGYHGKVRARAEVGGSD